MKVAIASDHAGFELKGQLIESLPEIDWVDLGTNSLDSVNYPDFGKLAAETIISGKAQRAVIVCGTGIGISIAANRFPEIRAALCTNTTMARLTRAHNDANVLALGSRITGFEVARDCVVTFLDTPFEGGRHQTRVELLGASD
jgi:ribose 5-phosphate isomerase B